MYLLLMSVVCSLTFCDDTDLQQEEWRQTSILGRGFGENDSGEEK